MCVVQILGNILLSILFFLCLFISMKSSSFHITVVVVVVVVISIAEIHFCTLFMRYILVMIASI